MTDLRPTTGRWLRDIYRDAVWESEDLAATEKAVAETYARHARDENDEKSATADLAWLTYPRLMDKAGIGRRANVSAAVAVLVERGWLTVVREVSRRPTLYRLTIPATAGSSDGGTRDRGSDGGTTVVPKITSGSSTSGPGSSDGGTQPLRPSKNQPSDPSPLPPVDTNSPTDSPTGEGGTEEFDSDQQQRINTLAVEILALRPDDRRWTAKTVRDAITRCLADGKHLDDIERAFLTCATDPDTKSPGRLPLDFYWWALPEDDDCPRCHGTAQIDDFSDYGGHPIKRACPDCTDPDSPPERCPQHPHYPLRTCGPCRSDRIARGNEQPRSGERGRVAPSIRAPFGSHTAKWQQRRDEHKAYSNPTDQSEYTKTDGNHHLLDPDPEASR